jgi:CheY-like chemotaxis protein
VSCDRTSRTRKDSAALLIVDADLAFAFCLGRILDRAGYESVPAANAQAASELIGEHRLFIDLLVMDPLPGNAIPFLRRLRQSRPALCSVAALPPDGSISDVTSFTAAKRKPLQLTAAALRDWAAFIQLLKPAAEGCPGGR